MTQRTMRVLRKNCHIQFDTCQDHTEILSFHWKDKRKRVLNSLNIGGKTGTITGGLPYGKRDWFVSYAIPKNNFDKGISLCVMIVNVKKWYIKSPVLAKNIIEYYYSRVQKIGKL